MKNIIVLLLLLSGTQSLLADTQYQHGLYALFAVGRGYNNFSASNFSYSPALHNDQWTLAGRVALGFNIDKYMGLEFGGRYFRERKFSNLQQSGYNGTVNEHAYTLQTVIRWPFATGFSLLAKFGPAYVVANRQVKSSSTPISQQGLSVGVTRGWQPMYSLGLSMTLDDYPGLSLLAEYSSIAKDPDKSLPESQLYNLGIIFHF